MESEGILVKVNSLKEGYCEFEHIALIRITSEQYNLVIMEDYAPVINELSGDISFLKNGFEKKYEHITGFYRLAHNEFTLVILTDEVIKKKDDEVGY